jgi:hypothetical protein
MAKDQVTTYEADRLIVVLGLTIALTSGCATGTAYKGNAWGNVPFGTGMAMNLTRLCWGHPGQGARAAQRGRPHGLPGGGALQRGAPRCGLQ